jgi:metacaspase-1
VTVPHVGRIRAVLVGVDTYERPDIPTLSGCVNDVALVRRVLKDVFGVPNEDIRVVVNERATKANIMHRLHSTLDQAEDGDVVVFYFSGHGSQIRDRDGDELFDRLDELICPHDMDWERKTYIVDDDLDALIDQVPPEILVEVFVDCCFWGAGPRELQAESWPEGLRADVRYLAPPFDIAARFEGDEPHLHRHGFVGCECFVERNVFWAASSEGEPAAEDYLEGRAHGVFTYWGCRFIEANFERMMREGYSREELIADLRAYLRSLGYTQSAELSAPDDLRVLAPLTREPRSGRIEDGGRAGNRVRVRRRGR